VAVRRIKETKPKTEETHPVGVAVLDGRVILLCRNPKADKGSELYFVASKKNFDGINFAKTKKKIVVTLPDSSEEELDKCSDFRFGNLHGHHYMTYVRQTGDKKHLVLATSKDMLAWNVDGIIGDLGEPGVFVSDYSHDGKKYIYSGNGSVKEAISKDLKQWYVESNPVMSPRGGFFDHSGMTVISSAVTASGIVLVYDASYKKDGLHFVQVGAALLSLGNPEKVIWRSEVPLWGQFVVAESEKLRLVGGVFLKDKIHIYYVSPKKGLLAISVPEPFLAKSAKRGESLRLQKYHKNPIIEPNPENDWESVATFNPAVLYDEGKMHILYRAIGKGDVSVLGYASSKDGFTIDERLSEPAYVPREKFEGAGDGILLNKMKAIDFKVFSTSGGGWGGCEDPRMTRIGDTIYLVYVAFNGYPETNIALSSIPVKDFYAHNWSEWKKPVLITSLDPESKNPATLKEFFKDKPWYKPKFGIGHKNPAILPEKINGKFVVFHRIWPNIVMDFVDDLDAFDGKTFLKGEKIIRVRPHMWDSHKISIGATPIKTDKGWLVFYNGVDKREMSKYKIGAMILDATDPSKVLYRSRRPILEPDQDYENFGHKFGVVFTGGAAVKDGNLMVYYGGSDKVVCVASIPIDKFLFDLSKDVDIHLTPQKTTIT